MPSRNTTRYDIKDMYYHVYSRGVNKQSVFSRPEDKDYFLYLLSRHLSPEAVRTQNGYNYAHLRGEIELIAYCLMDNHFHLLVYQKEVAALAKLMKGVTVAYTAYFNNQFTHIGPVFNGRYRAAPIFDDVYLLHISRYIHLNPRSWKRYPHSSFRHIKESTEPGWLQTDKLLALHPSRESYAEFVADYEDYKRSLEEIKHDIEKL